MSCLPFKDRTDPLASERMVHARPKPRISIFDLDRTITRRGTYSSFLLFCALRRSRWRLLCVPLVLVNMGAYKLGIVRRKTLKERMQRLMLGARVPRGDVSRLAERFAHRLCGNGLDRHIVRLAAEERRDGHVVMIATAAHRFYAEAIADKLGIAHVIATESCWEGEHLTSTIDGENCYGLNKALKIAEYLGERNIRRSDIDLRFYSDDASDIPCFVIADEQFAVKPSRKLAVAAHLSGWHIIPFR